MDIAWLLRRGVEASFRSHIVRVLCTGSGAKTNSDTGDDEDDPNEHRGKPRRPPLLREEDGGCPVECKYAEEIEAQVDTESD